MSPRPTWERGRTWSAQDTHHFYPSRRPTCEKKPIATNLERSNCNIFWAIRQEENGRVRRSGNGWARAQPRLPGGALRRRRSPTSIGAARESEQQNRRGPCSPLLACHSLWKDICPVIASERRLRAKRSPLEQSETAFLSLTASGLAALAQDRLSLALPSSLSERELGSPLR